MVKLELVPIFIAVGLLSGCWFANDFSACGPECAGQCVDGICVATHDAGGGDTTNEPDQDEDKTACTTHFECDQTSTLEGTELCLGGFCETVIFDDGDDGGCEELVMSADGSVELSASPENTLVIPALASLSGSVQNSRAPLTGLRMAVDLANKSGAFGVREVAFLLCDDTGDEQTAIAMADRLITLTGAPSFYSHGAQGGYAATLTASIAEKNVMVFSQAADVGLQAVPGDLNFRIFPKDQTLVTGMIALTRRYGPDRILIAYPEGVAQYDALALALLTELSTLTLVNDAPFDPSEPEAAGMLMSTASNGLNPADFVIFLGSENLPRVLLEYRNALGNGFDNITPRIITNSTGASAIPDIVSAAGQTPIHQNLTPNRVELIAGAANPTAAYDTLYEATFGAGATGQASSLAFDATFALLAAHLAAPGADSGQELAAALRQAFVPSDDATLVAPSALMFTEAGPLLGSGMPINYEMATGGDPLQFSESGDFEFPIAAATTPTGDPQLYAPTRVLIPGTDLWLDFCEDDPENPFLDCPSGWTDEPDDPGQSCLPPQQEGGFGTCMPKCDVAAASCPHMALTCVPIPQAPSNICVPL